MTTPSEWIIWQLADTALPTGAFVSSNGLEIAFHLGLVTPIDRKSLRQFIDGAFKSASAGPLVFVNRVSKMLTCEGTDMLEKLCELDNEYDTFVKSNHITYRNSVQQGMAFLTIFDRSFRTYSEASCISTILSYKKLVRDGRVAGHLPITFSLICFALGIPPDKTSALFIFILAKGIISAAIRLNIVGPFEAQTILADYHGFVQDDKNDDKGYYQCSPLLDTTQAMHDLLYSRLFNS